MMKIRLISLPYIYTSMYFFVKPSWNLKKMVIFCKKN